MRTRVKFCGCSEPRDGVLAAECGADAIGLIFAPSPRRISYDTAAAIVKELPPFVTPVGVFVDAPAEEIRRAREIVPHMVVQLHGRESYESALTAASGTRAIKALHVGINSDERQLEQAADRYPGMVLMFDTFVAGASGGTGKAFNWRLIAPIAHERRVIVSGGLTAENVSNCVRTVRPFGVDVRSGVETAGRKDAAKMRAFIRAVRDTDAA